jgi:hypothetical protein
LRCLILQKVMNMKSIVVTYPDYQSLPKGIKRLLVASESHFFEEAGGASGGVGGHVRARRTVFVEEGEDRAEQAFALEQACAR